MANTEIRLILFFAAKDGEALYSQQKQDRELTVAQELLISSLISKFRLKLKKVKKSTRPFRYDLNQIPYDYTVSQFSHSVRSNSLRPRESQHARPPCPSPTPGVHSDSRPSSQ